MTSDPPGQVVLQQSDSNALGLPILIAIVVAALVISDVLRGPTPALLVICGVAAVLDAWFVRYVLRNMKAKLLVTRDEITFSRVVTSPAKRPAPQQVIKRTTGSTLTFRTGRNGPMGSQYTGYVLKLRDTATGDEVYAGAFGRSAVQKACEAQGWRFV
jgi:hypothetical protein